MEVNPLSIILVKSDSKGDRLLFRYPYEVEAASDTFDQRNGKRNPYALVVTEDLLQTAMPQTSNICKGQLTGFTDEVLSTLFAVKPELCHRKFELKVNDVRFVGHPTLLPYRANKDEGPASTILINIVFALQALASHSIVKCYYDLSKRLGKALRHEEKRCAYLSDEMKIMIAIHDELSAMDSDSEQEGQEPSCPHSPPRSAFHHILQKSSLARSLKLVFEELCTTGVVQVRMNHWILVSFCLPHKAHQFHNRGLIIEPETIDRCLRSLRPYHGMLLLVESNELLDTIPLDSSPSLIRLIMLYSPLKSLQTLAIEADLTLSQVFQLTGHLVYWAKATIIYPLCESNVYVIAPDAQFHLNSPVVEKFAEDFPGLCLIQVMSMLSLPAPLWFHSRAWSGGAALLARCIVWLLQRHLLLQLHTYVQFLPTHQGPPVNGTRDYYCEKHNGPKITLSDSLLSLNHLPFTAVTTPSSDISSHEAVNGKTKETNGIFFPINNLTNKLNLCNRVDEVGYKKSSNSNLKAVKIEEDTDVIDNPKGVFRENSLIFGDITCDSPIGSQASSPQSNGSIDNCIKIHISNSNNTDSSDDCNENGKSKPKSKWMEDSNESSLTTDSDNVEKADANKSVKNNLNAKYFSKQNKILNETTHTSDDDGLVLKISTDLQDVALDSVSKVMNSLNNLNVEESNVKNGHFLGLNEKDKSHFIMNNSNSSSASNVSERKFNSSNLKLVDTCFQPPTVISGLTHMNSCDVLDALAKNLSLMGGCTEQFSEESLLAEFTEEEKTAIFKIPAAHNPEDLNLMATLYKKGYFRGEQHLEEIMFMENLTRSQVLQLLDKFRDVLITYETEDPAIAMLYSSP